MILTEVSVSENAADEKTLVGPLIDKASADRIEGWVSSALARGANPLIKGVRRGDRMITPWLLENVPADEPVSCEEVFGPVVVMQKVASFQDGITAANTSRYGLQTSVFTQSLHHSELAYREIESGAVLVNIPTAFRIDASLTAE